MSTTTFSLPYSGGTATPWTEAAAIRPRHPALGAAAAILRSLKARYRDYRTLRAIEAMPMGLRKDIGWPAPGTPSTRD